MPRRQAKHRHESVNNAKQTSADPSDGQTNEMYTSDRELSMKKRKFKRKPMTSILNDKGSIDGGSMENT
jgi:hypothetical protein